MPNDVVPAERPAAPAPTKSGFILSPKELTALMLSVRRLSPPSPSSFANNFQSRALQETRMTKNGVLEVLDDEQLAELARIPEGFKFVLSCDSSGLVNYGFEMEDLQVRARRVGRTHSRLHRPATRPLRTLRSACSWLAAHWSRLRPNWCASARRTKSSRPRSPNCQRTLTARCAGRRCISSFCAYLTITFDCADGRTAQPVVRVTFSDRMRPLTTY